MGQLSSAEGPLSSIPRLRNVSIRSSFPISTTIPPRHFDRTPTHDISYDLFRSSAFPLCSPDKHLRDLDKPRPQCTTPSNCFRQGSFVDEGRRRRCIASAVSRFPRDGCRSGSRRLKGRQCIEIERYRLFGTLGRGNGPPPGSYSKLAGHPRSDAPRTILAESRRVDEITDPTLFVTTTVPAKGPFGGTKNALTVPLFPLVIPEWSDETSGGNPLFLFLLSIKGGGSSCVARAKNVIDR